MAELRSRIDESLFQVEGKVTCGGCGIEEPMRFNVGDRDHLTMRLPFGWRYGALYAEMYQAICKPVCSWECQAKVEDG